VFLLHTNLEGGTLNYCSQIDVTLTVHIKISPCNSTKLWHLSHWHMMNLLILEIGPRDLSDSTLLWYKQTSQIAMLYCVLGCRLLSFSLICIKKMYEGFRV
jgi:hypothetical protein